MSVIVTFIKSFYRDVFFIPLIILIKIDWNEQNKKKEKLVVDLWFG